jgi:hypothetical protein
MSAAFDYRVHWITAAAQLAVGGALLYCQLTPSWWGRIGLSTQWLTARGWPLNLLNGAASAATVNLLVALAIVISTTLVLERWLKRPGRLRHVSLAALLSLVAVVAALLALWRLNEDLDGGPQGRLDWLNAGLEPYSWVVRVPLVFGLGCTIYTAGWLAVRGGRWLLRRPPPASVA